MRGLKVGDTFLFRGLDGQIVPEMVMVLKSVGATGRVTFALTVDGEARDDASAQFADVEAMIDSEVWLYKEPPLV